LPPSHASPPPVQLPRKAYSRHTTIVGAQSVRASEESGPSSLFQKLLPKYNAGLDGENDANDERNAWMQRLPQRPAEHFLKDILSGGL
jgi:hypothetical protein